MHLIEVRQTGRQAGKRVANWMCRKEKWDENKKNVGGWLAKLPLHVLPPCSIKKLLVLFLGFALNQFHKISEKQG